MNDLAVGVIFLGIVLVFAVIAVVAFEQNKRDTKEHVLMLRRTYDEAFKKYLDDPLNNERPEFNPEIWRKVYDWL